MGRIGKIIAVDLDGVLSEKGAWDEGGILGRKPKLENIEKVNRLFDKGYIIVIYTARLSSFDREETEAWLKKWKVKYNFVVFDKVSFDYYVDEGRRLIAIEDLDPDKFEVV